MKVRSQKPEAARKDQLENQKLLASIYDTVRDVIFYLAVESETQFRFASVNAAFLGVTGLSRKMVVGKTVNEVIPEPSLTMVLRKYRQAIKEKKPVSWEETSDYPAGRLTGEVTVAPVFDDQGRCTHLVGSVHDITERKRAEMALRESEERFRILADNAPVMIWVSGTDKLCTFFNKPWLDFTGRTIEQELGNGWGDSVHPEDLERCMAIYDTSFRERRNFQTEYRLRRADGEYRWMLDHGVPLYRDSEFAGYIGSCIDLTERRQIEQQLRASEARLLNAQRLAKIGHWEREIEHNRSLWSEGLRAILGLKPDDPANLATFLKLVHVKDRGRIAQIDAGLHSSTGPVDIEYRIVRTDGDVRFVRTIAEAVRNDQGELVGLAGTTQDVTEQVKAKELLRDSEERLKSAERLAHLGHWEWNVRTDHLIWSDEQYQILGYPRDFTPSLDAFRKLVTPKDRKQLEQRLKKSLEEKRGISGEIQIVRPDGSARTLEFVAECLLDKEGAVERQIGTTRDITDLKRYEAELLQNQNDLRALAARLVEIQESGMKELARELHDELSQSLAALGMEMSALLGSAGAASESLSERVAVLRSRVSKLAIDFHSIARRLHPAILHDLGLEAALREECQGFSARTGIPVQVKSRLQAMHLNAEVSLCFYRVAQEGFHNIAKHAHATQVRLILSRNGGSCSLQIEDNGQGFDPATIRRRNCLGLISMEERVRQLNGDFRIHSRPGEGTKLEISVPHKAPRRIRHSEAVPGDGGAG